MNINRLKLPFIAFAVLFFACNTPEVPPLPDTETFSLSVEKTLYEVGASKNQVFLKITANVNWTVATTAEWIKFSTASGTGNANVVCTFAANMGDRRTAAITVSSTAEGVEPITVEVVQVKNGDTPIEKYLKVGQRSFSVAAAGDVLSFDIESNVAWTVTTTADWIETDPASGTGNEEVVFMVDTNTGNQRTAAITVSSTAEGVSPVTVEVVQAGSTPPNPDGTTYRTTWAELPIEYDADCNGVDDKTTSLYYAHHLCGGGEKNAQKNGTARNYTVCYSSEYHCPVWVAAPRHDMYEGSSGRSGYSQDPKIPSNIQYNSKDTGGGCNKGHMLGSAERTCSSGTNKQVFYYTNIAPQLSSTFNTGGGAWNNLEDYIDGLVPADTLYEVVGCYFDPFTDAYGKTSSPKTISFGGRSDVAFPTMFYYALLRTKKGNTNKSVMNCSASELQCVAFVIRHTMEKGHEPQAKDLISIAELEELTGFTYFSNVPNAPKTTFTASDWKL